MNSLEGPAAEPDSSVDVERSSNEQSSKLLKWGYIGDYYRGLP